MLVCNVHSAEFVHKSGTSKAGKPYDFWCCPEKLANGDFCQDKGIQKTSYESAKEFDNSITDTRSHRIERQHSQEMALRYLDIKGVKEFGLDELKKTINWFVEDLEN